MHTFHSMHQIYVLTIKHNARIAIAHTLESYFAVAIIDQLLDHYFTIRCNDHDLITRRWGCVRTYTNHFPLFHSGIHRTTPNAQPIRIWVFTRHVNIFVAITRRVTFFKPVFIRASLRISYNRYFPYVM